MKLRRNYILTILAIICLPAIFMIGLSVRNRYIVAKAHRALQKQGIRTKPAQFDFLVPHEFQERGLAVLRADLNVGQTADFKAEAGVVRAVGALGDQMPVIWRSNYFKQRGSPDPWPSIRSRLQSRSHELGTARAALLAGPFGFRVKAADGIEIKTGHIRQIPSALWTFNLCIVADLHEGRFDHAWTNVLAASRCVTAWKAEPTAVAQKTRFQMAPLAAAGIWQALRARVWSEAQFSALEREWTNINFLAALPEMVEFEGASLVQALNVIRTEFTGSNLTVRDLMDEPKHIPTFLNDHAKLAWYRAWGLHDDQRDILFYYRDRCFEVRRAVAARSLVELAALPGMTNVSRFVSRHNSFIPSFIDYDHFSLTGRSPRAGAGWIALAALAEIHRRLIVAAIALEKHRLRTGEYPQKIEGTEFVDFATGEKLTYERLPNGDYLLSSFGLFPVPEESGPIYWPSAM